MKKNFLFFPIFMISLGVMAQERYLTIDVENNWDKKKTDEPVIIKLAEVKNLDFTVRSAKVINATGQELAYQLDDMNGDMKADELIFLTDIAPHEKQSFTLLLSAEQQTRFFTPRVYADIKLNDKKKLYPKITAIEIPQESYVYNDLYHHGAAFESELTAYRIYLDQRQNIDLYGKHYRRLELDETGFYSTPELQKKKYGNDVLWAGNRIGCGSFKGWDGKSPVNLDSVKLRGQKIIASGPLRTVIEVKDLGWKYGSGLPLNMKEYLIQYAGHRDCEISIVFDAPLNGQRFCTGVQKVGETPKGNIRKDGLAFSWGRDYPEMGMKEEYPPETIGLGIYLPSKYIHTTIEDDSNFLFIVNADGLQELKYHITFCADKEKDGYHSSDTWFDSLEEWMQNINHPVDIQIKKR